MSQTLPPALIAALNAQPLVRKNDCSTSERDCGYFGCFPQGSECPADCDTYPAAETCDAARTGDNRQACAFNPQYSNGKGLCQKHVTCYNLPGDRCSPNCDRCGYFGCLPSAISCPAACEQFLTATACETLGGVAAGLACQWDKNATVCGPVPLAKLTRILDPPPLRAYAAATIDANGILTLPPGYPTDRPSLDWAGAQNNPGRVVLYVGFSVAVIGVISVVALLVFRRARKTYRNNVLVEGLPGAAGTKPEVDGAAAAAARAGSEETPETQYHRDSLLVHLRQAISEEHVPTPQPLLARSVATPVVSPTAAYEAAHLAAGARSPPDSPIAESSATVFARRLSAK